METFTYIFVLVLLIAIMGLLVVIYRKVRKGGGNMFFVSSGAMDEFYTKDKKRAVEMIVEINADKKMEEQCSSDPKKKDEQK